MNIESHKEETMRPILKTSTTILRGVLAGHCGTVLQYFMSSNEVELEIDEHTTVITSADNIEE